MPQNCGLRNPDVRVVAGAARRDCPIVYYPDLVAEVPLDFGGVGVAVGWLERGHEFPRGPVPGRLIGELIRLADEPRKLMRGYHDCDFCDVESPIEMPLAGAPRGVVVLGHAEMYVCGEDGVVFAAPSLIVHYVRDHGYQPPQPFVDAVLREPRAVRVARVSVQTASGRITVGDAGGAGGVTVEVAQRYPVTLNLWAGTDVMPGIEVLARRLTCPSRRIAIGTAEGAAVAEVVVATVRPRLRVVLGGKRATRLDVLVGDG